MFRPMARKCDGTALAHSGALVDQGALRPLIEVVLPFDDVAEAHRRIEQGRSRGKLVLTMG